MLSTAALPIHTKFTLNFVGHSLLRLVSALANSAKMLHYLRRDEECGGPHGNV